MQILKVLPKNLLSRTVGELARIEKPAAMALAVRDWFIKRYKINVGEAELPLEKYPTLAALFTRKLKAGVRPIGTGIVHPCDANLTCVELINSDSLIQAKGIHYSLNQMLCSSNASETFNRGAHLVYYLCPTDYHRVHAPVDCEVTEVIHQSGQLWPVNSWSVSHISNLFAVNERVIFNLKTALGPAALVMVGATNVGQISVSFDSNIVTNAANSGATPKIISYSKPISLKKGDEMGIFHMGSTVVMIYSSNFVNVLPPTGPVNMGKSL
ncbi:MAG: archaetidylserine decarboxylase [Bdellovibrionales bacterium]